MPYRLRPGLHFCICSNRAVFLDVEADRYFCLPAEMDAEFQRWAAGYEASDLPALASLNRLEVVIETQAIVPIAKPPELPVPTDDLHETPAAGIAWIFWAAIEQLIARTKLRWSSFATLIEALQRGARRTGADGVITTNHEKIASAFVGSRLVVHSWDNCLSQSLAFHRACRRLGSHATFVIGVRLDPFSAHCWVQRDAVVLNDSVERVRHYTPILAI